MNRKRVLLLFGGESLEHDVSVSSARNVYAAIDDEKFDVQLCYIDRHGKWWSIAHFDEYADRQRNVQLVPVLGNGGFTTIPDGKMVKVDVILPILHGRGGEDGSVQGLAQLLHVPIVGCDIASSSSAMNKLTTKEILQAHDIKVIPYRAHRAYEQLPDFSKLTMQLGNPLFVKPARTGSSIGVSKVFTAGEFAEALEKAHQHDTIAIIEQAIEGQELEVAVLGGADDYQVSGVGEIVPGEAFYSYEDKYDTASKAEVRLKADIDDVVAQEVQKIAGEVYKALDCSGLARVDFLLSDKGVLYVLEVNTMPGFTNISMYPKLWRQEGIGYPQLIGRLLEDALK